jgi:2-keto-4-pentenoate hydratase/2-oxohepta-3-ene-1,7-dioic acid hydratase in catechol pathway
MRQPISAVDIVRLLPFHTQRPAPIGSEELATSIAPINGELIYPDRCNRLDYEGEIAIVLGKRGVDLKPSQLKSCWHK